MSTVSVIIPTYQRAELVGEAIRTVQSQTYQDVELIVVNDGSTDNTAEVLAQFGEQIVTLHHAENRGLSAAWNTGIRAAKGDYIAFLDDDDLWLPEKLAKQVAYLKAHPEIGLLYTDAFSFDREEGLSSKTYFKSASPFVAQSPLTLFIKNYVPVLTVMVRRACFDEVGLFDESLKAAQDYDMWLRIFEKFPVAFLNEPLACSHVQDQDQIQSDFTQHLENLLQVKENARQRNALLQRLPAKTLHTYYYHLYLTLARHYSWHGEGQAARQTLHRYRKLRGLTRSGVYLWSLSWLSPLLTQRTKRREQQKEERKLAQEAKLEAEADAYLEPLIKSIKSPSPATMSEQAVSEILLSCLSQAKEKRENIDGLLISLSLAEWQTIIELATERYGVTPLLYQHLQQEPALPATIRQQLQQIYLQNAGRNLWLSRQLHPVLLALAEKGISVIILKGFYLARFVYADPALRTMNDIDILVRKEDLELTDELLQALGYQLKGIPDGFSKEDFMAKTYHFEYLPPDEHSAAIEVHWALDLPTSPIAINIESLWARAEAITLLGVPAYTLSPEDLLLHLCLHAGKGRFQLSLRIYCDISATIQACAIDWREFVARTERWQASKAVYLALYLTHSLLGTEIPSEFDVYESLKPASLNAELLAIARQQSFAPKVEPASLVPTYFGQLREGSAKERLSKLARAIFMTPQELAKLYDLPAQTRRAHLYKQRLTDLSRRTVSLASQLLRGKQEQSSEMERVRDKNLLGNWLNSPEQA